MIHGLGGRGVLFFVGLLMWCLLRHDNVTCHRLGEKTWGEVSVGLEAILATRQALSSLFGRVGKERDRNVVQ